MKAKGKWRVLWRSAAAVCLIAVAVFALGKRLPECFAGDETALAAAAFTLTDGKFRQEQSGPAAEPPTTATQAAEEVKPAAKVIPKKGKRDKTGYYDSYGDHTGEAKYSVAEKTIGADDTMIETASIHNGTGIDYDFPAILTRPLTFHVDKNAAEPQVLIYHTHTSEAYLDEDVDFFYESFYSRTQNADFSVVGVGNALAQTLEEKGIRTLHDTTVHDSAYIGSYDRSADTVYADLDEHPSIRVVLDIHRDALGTEECKVKTVFEHDGQKAAQIMILAGCDCYNERGFDHWENNLNFALKLQTTAERLYPGMTRPLSFDFFAYNEYICDGSLLIEVGTDANSIDEAERTAQYLGNVLAEVLG